MTPRKVADRDEAAQLLHDAAASGLPRAAWARLHGINARSLNAWRVIFERREARRPAPPLHLVELVPRRDPPSESGVRVRCGALVVEVDPNFEDHVLARVLAVVARC
jgi:phage terminase large subunit-like protein